MRPAFDLDGGGQWPAVSHSAPSSTVPLDFFWGRTPSGDVVNQSPSAETSVPKNSLVNLTICQYKHRAIAGGRALTLFGPQR